ncbi:MAG: hypothetical protein Q4B42_08075 [Oscillospiraceae bacterium]|nr:hypothetical protein [Oscillospiraceae bacterium]
MISRINRSAPNLVLLCVDRREGGNFSGELHDRYSPRGRPFSSMEEMQKRLESFYDRLGCPQASTKTRGFSAKAKGSKTAEERAELKMVQDTEKLLQHKGDIATFVIHVKYRQNASWQGNIVWAEKKQESSFRSALEMIKLIDAALDQSETPPEGNDEPALSRPKQEGKEK